MRVDKKTTADGTKVSLTVDRGTSRVFLPKGFVDHKSADGRGARTIYSAGRFYDLPNKLAALLIHEGTAEAATADNEVIDDDPVHDTAEIVDDIPLPAFRSVHPAAPVVHDEPTDDDDPTDEE